MPLPLQVLMYEVYSGGKVPYSDLTAIEVLKAVSAGRRLVRPSPNTPSMAYELMRKCMESVLENRPTMTEVCKRLEIILLDSERETEL